VLTKTFWTALSVRVTAFQDRFDCNWKWNINSCCRLCCFNISV